MYARLEQREMNRNVPYVPPPSPLSESSGPNRTASRSQSSTSRSTGYGGSKGTISRSRGTISSSSVGGSSQGMILIMSQKPQLLVVVIVDITMILTS